MNEVVLPQSFEADDAVRETTEQVIAAGDGKAQMFSGGQVTANGVAGALLQPLVPGKFGLAVVGHPAEQQEAMVRYHVYLFKAGRCRQSHTPRYLFYQVMQHGWGQSPGVLADGVDLAGGDDQPGHVTADSRLRPEQVFERHDFDVVRLRLQPLVPI